MSTSQNGHQSIQMKKKQLLTRQSTTFNMQSIKKLNQDLALKLERQKVQQDLQSVKQGTRSVIDDIPMMTFDEDPQTRGWKSIYLGLYSPFSNKYTSFMKQAIERAKEESQSPTKKSPQHTLLGTLSINNSPYVRKLLFYQCQFQRRNQQPSRNGLTKGRQGSVTDTPGKKGEKPTSSINNDNQEMTQAEWIEYQEQQFILMFETLSDHKRTIIEAQIRNGSQSFIAQKYLQLVQQKKIKRTLQKIFQASKPIKKIDNSRRGSNCRNPSHDFGIVHKEFNRFESTLLTPQTEHELDDQNQIHGKHNKTLSLNEFKFVDLKWKGKTSNIPTPLEINNDYPIKIQNFSNRSSSAPGKLDIRVNLGKKIIATGFFTFKKILPTKPTEVRPQQKQILRRKSCECQTCGGEIKKIPISALFEEDEDQMDQIDEQENILISNISLKLQQQGCSKPRNSFLVKNLKQLMLNAKSPLNRNSLLPAYRRSSKTLANLFGLENITNHQEEAKQEKEKDFKQALKKFKNHNNKYFSPLSPIFDIEIKRKKKMGLNPAKIIQECKPQQIDEEDKQSNSDSSESGPSSVSQSIARVSPLKSQNSSKISPQLQKYQQRTGALKMTDKFKNLKIQTKELVKQTQESFFYSRNNTLSRNDSLKQSSNNLLSDLKQQNSQILKQQESINQQQQLKTFSHIQKEDSQINVSTKTLYNNAQIKFLERVSNMQLDMKYNIKKQEEKRSRQNFKSMIAATSTQASGEGLYKSVIELPSIKQSQIKLKKQSPLKKQKKGGNQKRKNVFNIYKSKVSIIQ